MIHVQIASDITTVGVEGVRWVLVEACDGDPPAAPVPAPPSIPAALSAPTPAAVGPRAIGPWQLAITGLGLLLALGLAQRQLGLPKLPWLAAPAVSQPMAPQPLPAMPLAPPATDAVRESPAPALPDTRPPAAPPVTDGPGPVLPAPAASAALPERQITAGLR